MTALDNKDTFFGLRMRKRRTRLAIIFSVFIILAYFDPLKREVDEEAEKSSLGITSTPKGELSAETKAQTMVKSDKPPLATSLRDTHDNSQSSDAIISSQFIFPVGTYPSSHSATIIALDNEEEEEEGGRVIDCSLRGLQVQKRTHRMLQSTLRRMIRERALGSRFRTLP